MLYNFLNSHKNSHLFVLYGVGVLQLIIYRYILIGLPIGLWSLLESVWMCFLLLINIFTINLIIRKNQLSEGHFLVVFFWIVQGMYFPELYRDSTVMIAQSCILFVIYQIMQLHNIADGRQAFFDISLLIFLASLFFLPSLLALLLLWIQIFISPGNKFRNFLIPITTFALLFVFLLSIFLVIDKQELLFAHFYYLPNFDFSLFLHYKYLPLIGLLLFNLLVSTWLLKKRYKRYYSGFLVSLLLVGVVGIILYDIKNAVGWLYLSFPTALSSMLLIEWIERRWLRELLLWLYVCMLVLPFFFRDYLL